MPEKLLWAGLVSTTVLLLTWKGLAQHERAALPDEDLTQEQLVRGLSDGTITVDSLRRKGLTVFTTPFNTYDGYGDGPFSNESTTNEFGHRPTLQGNGLSLRINGLDAQSCNECHSVVKNSTVPPVLGIGGAGGIVQNALIQPTIMDVADSKDPRVSYTEGHNPDLEMSFDGKADFNGRFSNPPFLFGGGGIELLAKEMTEDLQRLLSLARVSPPGTITYLSTKGVEFGSIKSLSGGEVELHVEGIGFEDNRGRQPEDVLVVRPFGRKGEKFSMRDFSRTAMQFHFGLQPAEVVGRETDADHDGVVNEATVFEMTALHVFSVTNPAPVKEGLDLVSSRGSYTFNEIGCASCHMPVMQTRSQYLPLAFPEVAHDPSANIYMEVDLVEMGFEPAPGGGVFIPLFADLKRYDMGDRLAEDFELADISNREFTTARLWGIVDTAPYLHDGRATTLAQAIEMHGGDAEASRDAFLGLSDKRRAELVAFLESLRTPDRPNEELLVP